MTHLMESLLQELDVCEEAYESLQDYPVCRVTWETHPFFEDRPENLIWFALTVGVDPRWCVAAAVWILEGISDKPMLEGMVRFAQQGEGFPNLAIWRKWYRHVPGLENLATTNRDYRFKEATDLFVVTLRNWTTSDSANKVRGVLTWDRVQDAMLQNGFKRYLEDKPLRSLVSMQDVSRLINELRAQEESYTFDFFRVDIQETGEVGWLVRMTKSIQRHLTFDLVLPIGLPMWEARQRCGWALQLLSGKN